MTLCLARVGRKMSMRVKSDVLFSFGAIADVQCGELDDRLSVKPNRYYRNALRCFKDAVGYWNQRERVPLFVLQLGDVLDGFNILRGGKEQATRVLRDVLTTCQAFSGEFHHAWGNHELYNFSRLELLNSPLFSGRRFLREVHPQAYKQAESDAMSLQQSPVQCDVFRNTIATEFGDVGRIKQGDSLVITNDKVPVYYEFSPYQGFRFVLLDTFDISTLGYEEGSREVTQALSIIQEHNKNDDIRDWSGLCGRDARFVSFNGGIGSKQLAWLRRVLEKAKMMKEKVIIFGHVPVYPEVTLDFCLVWNYAEVLEVIRSSECVVATLFGHTHQFNHRVDEVGIHHILLPGIVECEPGTNGFVTFDLSVESMVMHVAGMTTSIRIDFRTT